MKVVILRSAIRDWESGSFFYEAQQPGLGRYFMDSLLAEIDTLSITGGVHRSVFGAHRSLAKIFPFAIYYSMTDDTVRVKAVLDCRRDPEWIKRRLP